VPQHEQIALTKPAHQWVCGCRFCGATTGYQSVDGVIIPNVCGLVQKKDPTQGPGQINSLKENTPEGARPFYMEAFPPQA